MTSEFAAALRRRKPERRTVQLKTRPAADLTSAADFAFPGRPAVLLDTNVYILDAAGSLPPEARALVESGLLFHCTVCLAELAAGVAHADPKHPGWARLKDHYVELLRLFPASRILTPDADTWIDAGLVSGSLARTQRFQPHQRKECLNDTLIYLTAAKAGVPVLTQNRDEFDLIQQIAPDGQFLYF